MELDQVPKAYRPLILIVDASHDNALRVQSLLGERYSTRIAHDGLGALAVATEQPLPDLILLDTQTPDLNGYEVCRQLKSNPATRDIPVIFMSATSDFVSEQAGFDLGGADYITQPISPAVLLARVHTQLMQKRVADFLRDQNTFLEEEVARRTQEVAAIQDVAIVAMALLAETRDSDTGNHIRRTQRYVKVLAWRLATHPRFASILTAKNIGLLYRSAPLHDIGKVGIPDRILLKPGKLTGEEFEIMKTHTTLGRDAIVHAERDLGVNVAFLTFAKEIAYSHQEKWDGSGYPQGLAGDQIPVSARLMALADVYDALISRRVYKEPMSHDKAVAIIQQTRGRHFDPEVVDAFLDVQDNFRAIATAYEDSDADIAKKADYLQKAIL